MSARACAGRGAAPSAAPQAQSCVCSATARDPAAWSSETQRQRRGRAWTSKPFCRQIPMQTADRRWRCAPRAKGESRNFRPPKSMRTSTLPRLIPGPHRTPPPPNCPLTGSSSSMSALLPCPPPPDIPDGKQSHHTSRRSIRPESNVNTSINAPHHARSGQCGVRRQSSDKVPVSVACGTACPDRAPDSRPTVHTATMSAGSERGMGPCCP